MKKFLRGLIMNQFFLLFCVIVVLVIHIWLNFKFPESNLFQRSGGSITLIGVVIVFRKKISYGFKATVEAEYIIDGGDSTDNTHIINKEAKNNVKSEIMGTGVILLGAIIASYGDLFFRCF